MSEKRFSWKTEKLQHLDDEVIIVVDNENNDWKGHILNIVDLLNELSDENNILNKNEDDLKECTIENIKLKKEIAELQEDINDYHTALFDLHKKYDKLEKENEQLRQANRTLGDNLKQEEEENANEYNVLLQENERLKNKLNVTALELVGEAISMGKAVEISEMSYREFIVYRAENGKPMELQL